MYFAVLGSVSRWVSRWRRCSAHASVAVCYEKGITPKRECGVFLSYLTTLYALYALYYLGRREGQKTESHIFQHALHTCAWCVVYKTAVLTESPALRLESSSSSSYMT
jgi:hypothetical protein